MRSGCAAFGHPARPPIQAPTTRSEIAGGCGRPPSALRWRIPSGTAATPMPFSSRTTGFPRPAFRARHGRWLKLFRGRPWAKKPRQRLIAAASLRAGFHGGSPKFDAVVSLRAKRGSRRRARGVGRIPCIRCPTLPPKIRRLALGCALRRFCSAD